MQSLETYRAQIATICREHHVQRLAVFGSVARGEQRADSDIDLLIVFESGHAPSLAGFARLREIFGAVFGVTNVDLATPSIMRNPYRRKAILAELQELYAA
jgi:predicted nucleotidyltransferase